MNSVAESYARLPRFAGSVVSTAEVAAFMGWHLPLSLLELTDEINSLPTEKTFTSVIETSTSLGGFVSLTLHNDGRYRFSGFMRATGFPSFDYRITAIVRGPANDILVAARSSGRVFGTDTPGNRQRNWDESGTDPLRAATIRNVWPTIRRATLDVRRSSDLSGVLGGAIDVARDITEIFVAAQTLGVGVAICIVIGNELGAIGVDVPGLGGVVGLGIVGGSVFIWGPLAIGPAIVAGVAIGAVVDALVDIRKLTDEQIAFAREVYANSIDFDQVRITNLLGLGDRPFTTPTVDGTILVNIGNLVANPTGMATRSYPVPGQLFIHELAHVWQIQHRSLGDGFVPGFLCEAAVTQTGGSSAYQPGAPGPDWSDFGIEAQATIVDRWFAGSPRGGPIDMSKPRIQMDPANPYNRYIRDNVQLGHA